jgi:hypothetical protein
MKSAASAGDQIDNKVQASHLPGMGKSCFLPSGFMVGIKKISVESTWAHCIKLFMAVIYECSE